MTKESRITAEFLRACLHYDPATGVFTRRTGKDAGQVAGGPIRQYWRISLQKEYFFAHRLAWLYVTGEWPKERIDHKDGDGLNNRWDNLRDVPQSINKQNHWKPQGKNSTGFLGIKPVKDRFQAQLQVNYEKIHGGIFDTPEEAHQDYLRLKRIHHPDATATIGPATA